jgi:hypothetical protein
MNDVTYIEAARMLAERMMKEGGASPAQQLAWAFRVVTSRLPDEVEQKTLQQNLDKQLQWYRQHPAEAEKFLSIGYKRNDPALPKAELAAATATVSLLLNLDEAITKH